MGAPTGKKNNSYRDTTHKGYASSFFSRLRLDFFLRQGGQAIIGLIMSQNWVLNFLGKCLSKNFRPMLSLSNLSYRAAPPCQRRSLGQSLAQSTPVRLRFAYEANYNRTLSLARILPQNIRLDSCGHCVGGGCSLRVVGDGPPQERWWTGWRRRVATGAKRWTCFSAPVITFQIFSTTSVRKFRLRCPSLMANSQSHWST